MSYSISNRRIRLSPQARALTREIVLTPQKMIQPLFVVEGIKSREPIPGLSGADNKGTFRDTTESVLKQIESDLKAGVKSFLLFGVPDSKSENNFKYDFTANQIASIRKQFGQDVLLSVDVCLCSYTSHGQCGILNDSLDHVVNGATVDALAKCALAYAQAGADCVAPSDMMDGRVGAIRRALDEHKLENTLLMSYSAKFHSGFYGPFRVAADSAPKGEVKLKDRATYQIDPGNPSDALRSSLRDADEGADILMVKPGLPYLDVLAQLSAEIPLPWAVYEVSGEYAAIELMAEKGLINRERAHLETWTAFARAGAQIIITYGARHAREWIKTL
ncbi:MAG: porphobilinogen synthase [Bdellovibrionales bacterium]|nr:porphobilinogen synthase [Bdellovibrionales bacterium]